jgi:hypothetical protein
MTPQERHRDVGAYALGVLDRADSFRFEEHLTDCTVCAVQLHEFTGIEALLADCSGPLPDRTFLAERPDASLEQRLVDVVEAGHRRSRRRRFYLVAAVAALIIAAPLATLGLLGSRATATEALPPTITASAVDTGTGVSAIVSMETKEWGTNIGLKMTKVSGPLDCQLIAVSATGDEQVVTSMAVPEAGYGMTSATASEWLVTQGGASLDDAQIDHFEVRAKDGRVLVSIDAHSGQRTGGTAGTGGAGTTAPVPGSGQAS